VTFTVKMRGTLLIPSGPDNHLHVIVTEECDNCHLLVGFSSIKQDIFCDHTCIVKGGEHKSLPHDSYAIYKYIVQKPNSTIIHCVNKGLFIPKNDMDESLFHRVCTGLKKSPFAPKWAKDYYDKAVRAAAKRGGEK
jgi:hypothetical protein